MRWITSILFILLLAANAHADQAITRFLKMQKGTPNGTNENGQAVTLYSGTELRAALRAQSVAETKGVMFDGVKISTTPDRTKKIIAVFSYLKKKDPQAWQYVKKNVSTVGVMEPNDRRINSAYAHVMPSTGSVKLNPSWVDAVDVKGKIPTSDSYAVTTIVHEAAHADFFEKKKDWKDEAAVDVYRSQVQARIDKNPL